MNDYLDRVEAQLTELTNHGAHRRLRARRPGFGRSGAARAPRPPRRRRSSELLVFLAAAAVAAAVVLIVVLNTGTSSRHGTSAAARSTTTGTTAATTTATAPGSTTRTTPGSTTRTAPAPIAPLPARFHPQSFTAISELTWWLLGRGAILRTTDGGRSFVAVSAPHAPASSYSQLRFADPTNGFAYGPGLYVTHNGGITWRTLDVGGRVSELAISGGQAFAVVGNHLMHSPVRVDAWGTLSDAGVVSGGLWVQGPDVIIQSGVGTGIGGTVLVSRDGGKSFDAHPAPSPGLPCQFEAPAPPVLWARCATGTESGVWRSTDLGAHFAPSRGTRPGQPNSAAFAAANAATAVYGYQQLYRTADAGATWTPVGPSGIAEWAYLGFTDSTHGVALGYVGSIAPGNERLYYTTDGGQSYHLVRLP